MICVAMGYPDDSFPANKVVSNRRPVSEVAKFIGFWNYLTNAAPNSNKIPSGLSINIIIARSPIL